jgi:hypothetical protein
VAADFNQVSSLRSNLEYWIKGLPRALVRHQNAPMGA